MYSQNWKKKIESKRIEHRDKMNLTRLNAPSAKKRSPRAIDKRADCKRESEPPVKSSMTFDQDQPTQLFLFQLR